MPDNLTITCPACGFANVFPQPYRYHAGFGDTAFVYNEAGNLTLIWGVYDAAYERLIGNGDPWQLSPGTQRRIEGMLPISPAGDRWSFQAPARCTTCHQPISKPMAAGEIYYLEYPGSLMLGRAGLPSHLDSILISRPST